MWPFISILPVFWCNNCCYYWIFCLMLSFCYPPSPSFCYPPSPSFCYPPSPSFCYPPSSVIFTENVKRSGWDTVGYQHWLIQPGITTPKLVFFSVGMTGESSSVCSTKFILAFVKKWKMVISLLFTTYDYFHGASNLIMNCSNNKWLCFYYYIKLTPSHKK
jgi:hypothetical protein